MVQQLVTSDKCWRYGGSEGFAAEVEHMKCFGYVKIVELKGFLKP